MAIVIGSVRELGLEVAPHKTEEQCPNTRLLLRQSEEISRRQRWLRPCCAARRVESGLLFLRSNYALEGGGKEGERAEEGPWKKRSMRGRGDVRAAASTRSHPDRTSSGYPAATNAVLPLAAEA